MSEGMIDRRVMRLAPEAILVMLGQTVAAGGSVFQIRVITGLLHPAAYGQLALALTGAVLAQQLILGPIGTACERYFAPSVESGELGIYIRAVGALFAAGTLALGTISLVLGIVFWTVGWRIWIQLLAPAFVYAWISSANSILDGVQNAARQRRIVAFHQGAGAWLRLGMVLLLARYMHIECRGILWCFSISYLLLICSQLFFLTLTLQRLGYRAPAEGISFWHLLDSMYRYAWPFSSWGIFTWVQACSDRWFLGTFAGLYQLGLYQSLYQVGYYPISMLTQFLLQVCTPIVFQRAGSGMDAGRRKNAERLNNTLTWIVLLATGVVSFLSALGGHKLLALVVAPAYRSHSGLISVFILASGCFAAGQIKSLNLMASLDTQRLIAPKVTTALVGTAAIAAGAYWLGFNGVAAAQVVFSAFYLIWIFCLDRKTSVIRGHVLEVA